MPVPVSSADNFDVLLAFSMDEEANKRVAARVSTIDEELKKIEDRLKTTGKAADSMSAAMAGGMKKAEAGTKDLNKALQTQQTETKKTQKNISDFIKDLNQAEGQAKKTARSIDSIARAQVLMKQGAIARRGAGILNSVGNQAGIAGVGIVGGILAEATQYAKKMGDATAETKAFNHELEEIAAARGRIDAVLAGQVLPILQTATKVANLTAGIIEDNPELVSFALKGGALLIAIGTLAKLAGTGLKIYADATFFTAQGIGLKAAQMQLAASTNQLAAAGKMSGGQIAQELRKAFGLGAPTAGAAAGGVAATAATVLAIVGVVLAGAVIGTFIYDQIAKLAPKLGLPRAGAVASGAANLAGQGFGKVGQLFGMTPEEANRKTLIFTALVAKLTGTIDESSPLWLKASELAKVASGNIKEAVDGLRGSENEAAIVGAFTKMKEGQLAAEKKYQADRAAVMAEANQDLINAARNNARAVTQINERANSEREQIISNFITASREAESKYAADRAQILRDSGEEIRKIEEDRLEKLRDLERDHNDRVDDLKANRDALGLVLEQRNFDRQREEIDSQANKEIMERRRDLAIRLQDLAASFAAERAQRIAKYQEDLKENEAQRIQALAAQRQQFLDEQRQIQENRVARLRELAMQYNEERQRLRQAFIDQVRDLDASLLGEQAKKRQYYALMLGDVERFLADYRSRLNSNSGGGTIPGFKAGGYTPDGVIRSHRNEFVANQQTTRALEALIGGQLTQGALLRSAAMGAAATSVVWNDRRRFSGEYSMAMRRENRRDTMNTLSEVFA